MLVKEWRSQFYDVLVRDRAHVLLCVGCDVDALCTAQLLQRLFVQDNVPYSLRAVDAVPALLRAVDDCAHSAVVLVNCGAGVSFVDQALRDNQRVRLYLIDTHRPIDLDNIYESNNRVMCLILPEEELSLNVPKSSDLYRSDDEESNGSDSEQEGDENDETASNHSGKDMFSSPQKKRTKALDAIERRAVRREERRIWEKRKVDLVWRYYEKEWFQISASLQLYNVAHSLNRATPEMLWWTIVGLTSQYLEGKISLYKYNRTMTNDKLGGLGAYVALLKHHQHLSTTAVSNSQENTATAVGLDQVKIDFDQEILLSLFHHWSLWDSINRSVNTVCRFELWTLTGERKLKQFLADMGITLQQSKEKYISLDTKLRQELRDTFTKDKEGKLDKWGLKSTSMVLGEYNVSFGYRSRFTASDFACALFGLVEIESSGSDIKRNFSLANNALTLSQTGVARAKRGIELYKGHLNAVFELVKAALNQNQISVQGPYLQCVLAGGGGDVQAICHPHGLRSFGRYLLRAYVATSRGVKHQRKPLLVAVTVPPSSLTAVTVDASMLVIGVPPVFVEEESADDAPFNILGRVFQLVAGRIGDSAVHLDFFDKSIVRIRPEIRNRFFDAVTAYLVQ